VEEAREEKWCFQVREFPACRHRYQWECERACTIPPEIEADIESMSNYLKGMAPIEINAKTVRVT
jgi:hypothetical protein